MVGAKRKSHNLFSPTPPLSLFLSSLSYLPLVFLGGDDHPHQDLNALIVIGETNITSLLVEETMIHGNGNHHHRHRHCQHQHHQYHHHRPHQHQISHILPFSWESAERVAAVQGRPLCTNVNTNAKYWKRKTLNIESENTQNIEREERKILREKKTQNIEREKH